jgi:hypothetical protein
MKRQSRDIQVQQNAINTARRMGGFSNYIPYIAKVLAVYSDRITCDLITVDGVELKNVPVLTKAGLIDGEPYGEIDLPAIGDYVSIMQIGTGERQRAIIGTFIPYLSNDFNADAVNSAGKAYTKKLMEEGKEKVFKKIFQGGTSFECDEDGTITVETPSGTYVRIDEAAGTVTITDQHGNSYIMDSSGVTTTDTNGNDVTMESGKVTINGNLEVLQ